VAWGDAEPTMEGSMITRGERFPQGTPPGYGINEKRPPSFLWSVVAALVRVIATKQERVPPRYMPCLPSFQRNRLGPGCSCGAHARRSSLCDSQIVGHIQMMKVLSKTETGNGRGLRMFDTGQAAGANYSHHSGAKRYHHYRTRLNVWERKQI
jgi:hypothetical protein